MVTVMLEGWRNGFEKVSLTKLQMEKLGISLKESKSNVDVLLAGESVSLEIKDYILAYDFLKKAEEIGATCRLVKN